MTAWWLDGAKLDLSDICEEISAVIYDKSSVHCINIPLETMGSCGDILRRSSGKWQLGSLRTWSLKLLSILRDGILMEVSKSLVEKGLKLNKQKKMCPTNFTFYSEMRMFCTHQTPDQAHILNSEKVAYQHPSLARVRRPPFRNRASRFDSANRHFVLVIDTWKK